MYQGNIDQNNQLSFQDIFGSCVESYPTKQQPVFTNWVHKPIGDRFKEGDILIADKRVYPRVKQWVIFEHDCGARSCLKFNGYHPPKARVLGTVIKSIRRYGHAG